jgi:hypothetical protein
MSLIRVLKKRETRTQFNRSEVKIYPTLLSLGENKRREETTLIKPFPGHVYTISVHRYGSGS